MHGIFGGKLKTIRQLEAGSIDLFNTVKNRILFVMEVGEASAITHWIFEDLFGLTRADILVNKSLEIDIAKRQELDNVVNRLLSGEPIQHILGYAYFRGLKFLVNRDTLIPRQETEELVSLVLERVPKSKIRILDIGTGSGILPVSLQIERRSWEISAWDVSEDALIMAKKNAMLNQVDPLFQVVDIFDPPESESFDLIISNPPYVLESEKKIISKTVLDYDPHLALFVTDEDPLKYYKAICQFSNQALKKTGSICCEINERFGMETCNLFSEYGYHVEIVQDINGKDRFIWAN